MEGGWLSYIFEGQPAAEVQEECAENGGNDNGRVEHVEHGLGTRTSEEWWVVGGHGEAHGNGGEAWRHTQ